MKHPIKEVIDLAGFNQLEASRALGISQPLLSYRMRKEIEGSIEQSIEMAKTLRVKQYEIIAPDYSLKVKIKL